MTKYHFFYITIILLLLFYLIFGNKGLIEYRRLLAIKKNYEHRTQELTKKTKKLEREIQLIRKDKDYLEAVIRKKLNFKKPNEELYIIDNESSNSN